MPKQRAALRAILVNDARQFCVWPAARKPPAGWRFAGPTGTEAEMRETLRRQFVETVDAPRAGRRTQPPPV